MSLLAAALVGALALLAVVGGGEARACDRAKALGVSRIVEIDASGGPIFGSLTGRARETRFLAPNEVVLTFDDGPLASVTPSILDTLDRFCTKATFFPVGRMAVAYPKLTREIMARGHTLGAHTWSHLSLTRLRPDRAHAQIDSGFAAVMLAAGKPIAPFFRFPGLQDSPALLGYLQTRGVASFTVDVVSNDSFIADPDRLLAHTFQRLEAQKGGILLFHDIKRVTARALPKILTELKARGYQVVHMRAKSPYVPAEGDLAAVRALTRRGTDLAATGDASKAPGETAEANLIARQESEADLAHLPVTLIAPAPRDRTANEQRTASSTTAPHHKAAPIGASRARSTASAPASTPSPSPFGSSWQQTFRRLMNGSGG